MTKNVSTIEEFVKEFNKTKYKDKTLYINGLLTRGSQIMIINNMLCVIYKKIYVLEELKLNSIKSLHFVDIGYINNNNLVEEVVTNCYYKMAN